MSVVETDEHPSALVIDVPAATSPAVWHLVERFGATLEELFAAVADQQGIARTTASDVATTTGPSVSLSVSDDAGNSSSHATSGISLDLQARSAWRDQREIHLTRLEFELLAYFVANPSRAINRNELLDNVWNEPSHFGSRTIDVHVRRLRRKLGPDLPLTTVRSYGYRLDRGNVGFK